MYRYRYLIALFLITILGCKEEGVLYSATEKCDEQGWMYGDTLSFSFDIKDKDLNYDLVLKMKHSNEYNRQNVYFNIITVFPDGQTVSDRTNFDLANSMGKWYGNCSRGTCKAQALIQGNFKFRQEGRYSIMVMPYTRTNPLRGFKEIGIDLLLAGE